MRFRVHDFPLNIINYTSFRNPSSVPSLTALSSHSPDEKTSTPSRAAKSWLLREPSQPYLRWGGVGGGGVVEGEMSVRRKERRTRKKSSVIDREAVSK